MKVSENIFFNKVRGCLKKVSVMIGITMLLTLTGCQTIQEKAEEIKSKSENSVNQASQQVEDTKNKIIEAKQKYDEKSQQFIDAKEAIEKLAE